MSRWAIPNCWPVHDAVGTEVAGGAAMPLALIISPVRSWPLDQGNRARVRAMGAMLKARGYTVHFLLSELEGGPSEDERRAMDHQWDLLRCVPYRHQRHQAHAEAWGADDWYDPALDAEIRALSRVWSYDLCLVNYAWYSRAFEALHPDVVRVIDTHDAFGDRHKRLYEAGTTPVWYFTRPENEAQCLDRADVVISIQEEEQAWFESLTHSEVTTIGHVTPAGFLPPRDRQGARLRAGYLASGNPSNQASIAALIRHWAQDPWLSAQVELHVAGPICREIRGSYPFLVKRGFVPDVTGFYESVDFAVNPNIGGSGLKIKSVESLSFGRPLFATESGMLGICPVDPPFVMADVAGMAAQMSAHLQAAPDLDQATRWAREIYLAYRHKHLASFDALLAGVQRRRAQFLAHHGRTGDFRQ